MSPNHANKNGARYRYHVSRKDKERLALPVHRVPAGDIENLVIGDTLKVSDLPALGGVRYLDDPEAPLLTVLIPRIEEEPEVEEDELLEGEEGELADEAGGEGAEDTDAGDDEG